MVTNSAIKRRIMLNGLVVLFGAILVLTWTVAKAQRDNQVSAIPELAEARESLEKATSALKTAERQGNRKAIGRAQKRYQIAHRAMELNLARLVGVEARDVAAMHQAGMGWGQIAEELGLRRGHLGLGEGQDETPRQQRFMEQVRARQRDREHMEATYRDMKKTRSWKHGMAQLDSGSKGMGLGRAKDMMPRGTSRGEAGHGHGPGFSTDMGGGSPGGGGAGGGSPGGGGCK